MIGKTWGVITCMPYQPGAKKKHKKQVHRKKVKKILCEPVNMIVTSSGKKARNNSTEKN